MPPAARVTDMHVCPMFTGIVPHVGGPIMPPCEPTVLTGFLPQARVTDLLMCAAGPPDVIAMGSSGVMVGFLPAARMGDETAHGGTIVLGEPTVMIGEIGEGATVEVTPMEPGLAAPGSPSLAQQIAVLSSAAVNGDPFCPVCQ